MQQEEGGGKLASGCRDMPSCSLRLFQRRSRMPGLRSAWGLGGSQQEEGGGKLSGKPAQELLLVAVPSVVHECATDCAEKYWSCRPYALPAITAQDFCNSPTIPSLCRLPTAPCPLHTTLT